MESTAASASATVVLLLHLAQPKTRGRQLVAVVGEEEVEGGGQAAPVAAHGVVAPPLRSALACGRGDEEMEREEEDERERGEREEGRREE